MGAFWKYSSHINYSSFILILTPVSYLLGAEFCKVANPYRATVSSPNLVLTGIGQCVLHCHQYDSTNKNISTQSDMAYQALCPVKSFQRHMIAAVRILGGNGGHQISKTSLFDKRFKMRKIEQ